VYCYKPATSDAGELPANELVTLVNGVAAQCRVRNIQLTGGEPLMREDLFQIAHDLRGPTRSVSLVTDGALIDDKAAAELSRLGVAPVQPTLLSARRNLHNELKGADCFDATIEAIGRLIRHRVPVSVSFVCTRQNYSEFRDVVELCFALGIRVVAFSRFCVAGRGAENAEALLPEPEMIGSCLDVAEEANTRLGMRVKIAISLPLCVADLSNYKHLRFGRCALSGGTPGLTIDPMGNLRVCSVSPTVLGNLRELYWGELMARVDAYLARVAAPPGCCSHCSLVTRCGGGCRESARAHHDGEGQVDPLAQVAAKQGHDG